MPNCVTNTLVEVYATSHKDQVIRDIAGELLRARKKLAELNAEADALPQLAQLVAPAPDKRHGGPYDRGSADSYYRRGRDPHYYVGGTGTSKKVEYDDMTAAEIAAYHLGYANNEAEGNFKY
jgi:hypothetical protein